MSRRPWSWCREDDCDTKIIFATRNGRRLPYEYADREPFSVEATGAHVLVSGQAFTPREAIEHFRVRFAIPEEKARNLLDGYPWHRRHTHPADAPGTTPRPTDARSTP